MSSVIVANQNADSAKKIAQVLKSSGLPVCGFCVTGYQLMEYVNTHYRGGVVVCSPMLKDISAVPLPREVSTPYDFLFLIKPHQMDMVRNVESLILRMPLNRMSLIASVNLLLTLADRERVAKGSLCDEEQLVIAHAKQLLMERNSLSEMQAYRFLQKKSMDTGRRMVEVSRLVLEQF